MVREAEEAALLDWARREGFLLDAADFDRRWREHVRREVEAGIPEHDCGGGSENLVYYDESTGLWVKRNVLTFHNNYSTFLQRLAVHNRLFPDVWVRFDGIVEGEPPEAFLGAACERVQVGFSQIHAPSERGATDEEVERHLRDRGFRPRKEHGAKEPY